MQSCCLSKDAVDRREVIRQFLMVDKKDVDVRMVDLSVVYKTPTEAHCDLVSTLE